MKTIQYISVVFSLLFVLPAFVSCSVSSETPGEADSHLLKLSVSTRATDNLAKGDDDKFSSLALYIFNEADGYCEYSELMTNLGSIDLVTRSIQVSNKTKVIYAIANYDDPKKLFRYHY